MRHVISRQAPDNTADTMATQTVANPSTGRPPAGWSVQTETRKVGGVERTETHFITRTGKKVSTMNEVHSHLKVRPRACTRTLQQSKLRSLPRPPDPGARAE